MAIRTRVLDYDKAKEMFESGKTVTEMALHFGVPQSTVRNALKNRRNDDWKRWRQLTFITTPDLTQLLEQERISLGVSRSQLIRDILAEHFEGKGAKIGKTVSPKSKGWNRNGAS